MRTVLKAMSVILMLALLGGCVSEGSVTTSTSAAPITDVSTASTTATSATEIITTEIETTSAVTSAQNQEYLGYDGKPLKFGTADFSQEPFISLPVSFGYYNDKIVRLGSDYIRGLHTSNEHYVIYRGDDGEFHEFSGGYSLEDIVAYGTLMFDYPYMSIDTADMVFIVNIEEESSIPFPYHDNTVQNELIINLGSYEENAHLSELIENKERYDGQKLWLSFSELSIGWSNVIWNQSSAVVKGYKIDERMDAITLKNLDRRIELTLSDEIDSKKLKEEIGYDLDIDLNELFKLTDEYYYEKSIESIKETYTGDTLADYERRNFLEEMSLISCYLGLPEADWIVCAGYGMYGVQGEGYARFFYIKDGEIVRELTPVEGWISGFYYDSGELFVSRIDSGLYKFDIESGTMSLIVPDVWGAVSYIDEDYIVFGNSMQKLYIRKTGELIETGINWCGLDPSYTFRVEGERIEFIKSHAYGTEEEKYVYNIETRTLEKDDSLIFERYEVQGHRNARYKAIVLSSMKNGYSGQIDYDFTNAVKVLDRETNTSKVYNLDGISSLHYYELYIDGDWLWISGKYAINLCTDEIAAISHTDFELSPEYKTASIWDYSGLYSNYKNYSVKLKYPDYAELNKEDIISQLGFDLPIELDLEIMKRESEEYANYWLADYGEEFIKESLERAEKQNYMDVFLDYEYVGNERADWVCTANYYDYYAPISSYTTCRYSKLIYIKDGRVSEVIAEFESEIYYMYIYNDKVYLPIYDDGIYELDMSENSLKKLTSVGDKGKETYNKWCLIDYADDNFVVYSDGNDTALKAYNLKSGIVHTSEIARDRDNGMIACYKGKCIYYPNYSEYPTKGYYEFNMETGETVLSEITADEFNQMFSKYME